MTKTIADAKTRHREAVRRWRAANPDKARAAAARWRANNRVHIRAYERRLRESKDPRYIRNHRQAELRYGLRKFGLTVTEFEAMLITQGGVCAICQRPPKQGRLRIDHDHKTNQVRGLLCATCNYFLAFLENEHWLTSATRYLAAFRRELGVA